MVLVAVGIVFAGVWLIRWTTMHPQFGLIQVTSMAMRSPHPPPSIWEKADDKVRSWLHLQQRFGPKSDYGLQIGPAVLGWSYANNTLTKRDGYIYLRDVRPAGRNAPLWELALSSKRGLRDVTRDDVPTEFYRTGDPRGADAFGSAWRGETILVPEGQILFARLETDPSVVYIIRLAKQRGLQTEDWATMEIEYVKTPNDP